MKRQYNHPYKSLCGIGAASVCFLLLLPCFRLLPVGAQLQTSVDASRDLEFDTKIRDFFDTIKRGNSSLALEELLRQSPLDSSNASSHLTELRNKIEEMKERFGEILRWEKYETKRIGEDIILIRYILKYERYPVIWTFTLYRKPSVSSSITNTNPWGLIELHFDTNLL